MAQGKMGSMRINKSLSLRLQTLYLHCLDSEAWACHKPIELLFANLSTQLVGL